MRFLAFLTALLLATPASAQNVQNQSARCFAMDKVLSGTVLDMSASCGFYTGQKWYNQAASPATAETQVYYNFLVGDTASVTATDPTFTGSANTAGSYWSLDGGDKFYHQAAAVPPSTFFTKQHRSDVSVTWSVWIAFRFVQNDATQFFIGNSGSSANAGWGIQSASTENVGYRRNDGTTLNDTATLHGNSSLVNGADYLLIFTVNTNTGAWESWLYSSGTTLANTTGTLNAVTLTALNNTSDTEGRMAIGTAGSSSSLVPNGTRIYEAGFTNDTMTDANAARLEAIIEQRTGLDLTP